ncbi:MAG: polysaccharide deacetylase family protein [bacterium]|nr:polysaccharide deacetylase family protein [bacterium]
MEVKKKIFGKKKTEKIYYHREEKRMYLLLIFTILWSIAFSCRWNWWRRNKPGIPILMYHYIGFAPKEAQNKKLWVSAKKFRQQMAYLKKHGVTSVTFKELKNGVLPDKPVIITFDDGRENNYTEAFPILKEYNFKACMFLPTQKCEISIEQLKEMQIYGLEFGSHTKTHPNLLKISESQAKEEIDISRKELEEGLNTRIIVFSYPYGAGAYNEKIKQMVKDAGYSFACGIKQGKVTLPITDNYSLRRLLVHGNDNIFDFMLNLKKGRSRL